MYRYYLSTSTNGNGQHVVHILFCEHGVEKEERENLGFHLHGKTALDAAHQLHPEWQISGCEFCCPDNL